MEAIIAGHSSLWLVCAICCLGYAVTHVRIATAPLREKWLRDKASGKSESECNAELKRRCREASQSDKVSQIAAALAFMFLGLFIMSLNM